MARRPPGRSRPSSGSACSTSCAPRRKFGCENDCRTRRGDRAHGPSVDTFGTVHPETDHSDEDGLNIHPEIFGDVSGMYLNGRHRTYGACPSRSAMQPLAEWKHHAVRMEGARHDSPTTSPTRRWQRSSAAHWWPPGAKLPDQAPAVAVRESATAWILSGTNGTQFQASFDAWNKAHPDEKIELQTFRTTPTSRSSVPPSAPARRPTLIYSWGGGGLKATWTRGQVADLTADGQTPSVKARFLPSVARRRHASTARSTRMPEQRRAAGRPVLQQGRVRRRPAPSRRRPGTSCWRSCRSSRPAASPRFAGRARASGRR